METIVLLTSVFPRGSGSDLGFGNSMSRLVPVNSGAGAGAEWGWRGSEQAHRLPAQDPSFFGR